MKFNEKIVYLRKKNGMSQEDLANQLDVSRQSVYKWESENNRPDLDKIVQISKLFNVSFDYLLNDNVDDCENDSFIKDNNKTMINRKVFVSKHKFDIEVQSAFDHGFGYKMSPRYGRPAVNYEKSNNEFQKKLLEAKEFFSEINISNVSRIAEDCAIFCFYDSKDEFFGLYFNGAKQFLCPIEKLLDVQIKPFWPSYSNHPLIRRNMEKAGVLNGVPIGYNIIIMYEDSIGNICNYQFTISAITRKWILNTINDVKQINGINVKNGLDTQRRMNSLELLVRACMLKKDKIAGNSSLQDVDTELLNQKADDKNNELQERMRTPYGIYNEGIAKQRKKDLIKLLIIIAFFVLFCIAIYITAKFLDGSL